MRVLNILLLGKSGVGKSTFINCFANYVSFEKVEDIKDNESIRVPIPCSFDVNDAKGKCQNFKKGEELNQDRNESLNSMSSGTQGCKAYEFVFEGLQINLIDTPGIVDTNGIDKDKQNMEDIIEFINNFNSIDGICILLKSNEERLDPVLRYCIFELLGQLDRSAAQNVVFGFTNARGTFYRPGATKNAVEQLIAEIISRQTDLKLTFSKENSFCFDSEAFRFLISKDSVIYDDSEKNMFLQSWSKSRQECVRMIKFIAGLPKHDVQKTISVYRARKLIESLSKPLVDIAENIMENKELCQKHEAGIMAAKDDMSVLKTKLYIPRSNISLEYFKLPRYICGSKKCTTVFSIGKEEKKHYINVCYEMKEHHAEEALPTVPIDPFKGFSSRIADYVTQLSLWGAVVGVSCIASGPAAAAVVTIPTVATVGSMAVSGIAAYLSSYLKNDKRCSNCSCRITDHFIAYYETRKNTERIFDETITSKMNKDDILACAQTCLKSLKIELEELEKHSSIINSASSTFSLFLKERTITSYNDATEKYLNYLIEMNKNYSSISDENTAQRLRLEEQKRQYKDKKAVIENGYKKANGMHVNQILPEHIDSIIAELCNLEKYGKQLKDSVDETQQMKKRDIRFRIINCRGFQMFQNKHPGSSTFWYIVILSFIFGILVYLCFL